MSWCEENSVQYVLELASNEWVTARIAPETNTATRKAKRRGKPAQTSRTFVIGCARATKVADIAQYQSGCLLRPGKAKRLMD
jgi:hypothetical protein